MSYTITNLLEQYQVIVPPIQRDYAQGRGSETELRKNFIRKIKQALADEGPALNLDFVYGYTERGEDDKMVFIPIDGQQRITTLWLLHWYLAPKTEITEDNKVIQITEKETQKILKAFSYKTRLSSKRFCDSLVTEPLVVTDKKTISEMIKDAAWFMFSWDNDPTVSAMLNMLDSLEQEGFKDAGLWKKLTTDKPITFDLIDIKSDEFKLTDELYIKMNSRGRPLTAFENFKALFSGLLAQKPTDYHNDLLKYQNRPVSYQQYFAFNVDGSWMDLMWQYSVMHKLKVDDCFLNLIYYIAEFLYFKSNPNVNSEEVKRDYDLLISVFSTKKNVDFLFGFLDILCKIGDVNSFFTALWKGLSTFDEYGNDYFLRCIKNENFEVKDKSLLYSIISYCATHNLTEPDNELKDFVRIVRNLLLTVRQPNPNKRIEYGFRLRLTDVSNYCLFIDQLLKLSLDGKNKSVYELFANNEFTGFGKENISHERDKAKIISSNTTIKSSIHQLEEHPEIQGNTSSFDLKDKDIVSKIMAFIEIWSDRVNNSLIVRAFLTSGDFSVKTHDYSSLGEIWYFGRKNYWNRILTAMDRSERKKVSDNLNDFLDRYTHAKGNSAEAKLKHIIENFAPDRTAEWRYYFVKYMHITESNYDRFNLYTWQDENGYNINSLGNSGKQPLFSYHINPYLIQLQLRFEDIDDITIFKQRYTDVSFLQVHSSFMIMCISEGWLIIPMNMQLISSAQIRKYELILSNSNYILKESKTKDKIEIATDFINEFL